MIFELSKKQTQLSVITSIYTYVTITIHTRKALWGYEWKRY